MTKQPLTHVEVVNGASYATLKQHFQKGEVYALDHHQWENLRNAEWPDGKPVFAVTDKEATHTPASTDRPDVVKGAGITVTHNTPKPMTKAEAEKAGLGSFFRGVPDEADTGAKMAGTGGEADNYSGPSGLEGLDEDDEVTIGGAATSDAAQEAPEAPQSVQSTPTKVTPSVKKPVVLKGGKKASPAPRADDVVKV